MSGSNNEATDPPNPVIPATPPIPAATNPSFFDRHKFLIVGLLLIAAIAAGFALGRIGRNSDKNQNRLVLYGNVDLRQVNLAFNDSERIAEVLVQEGAKITRGQVLARLDTSRLRPEAAGAEAAVEAQQAVVDRLPHGSRPQEIAQAQANVASAKADQVNATQQWTRLKALTTLTTGRAISEQDLESAKAAMDSAQAHLSAAGKASICQGLAPGRRTSPKARRNCASMRRNCNCCFANWPMPNSLLRAMPWCAPGSWSPARWPRRKGPVFNLGILDPKWVRAYVSESELGEDSCGDESVGHH